MRGNEKFPRTGFYHCLQLGEHYEQGKSVGPSNCSAVRCGGGGVVGGRNSRSDRRSPWLVKEHEPAGQVLLAPDPRRGKKEPVFLGSPFFQFVATKGTLAKKLTSHSVQRQAKQADQATVSADGRAMCAGPAKSQWKNRLILPYAELKMAIEVIVQRVESVSTRLVITRGGTDIIINLLPT
ncbi:hypothetical protein WN51_11866 [Melipona quadrifasciata]|uniref:Uncharacterized protein n=1 Tax=Melipona quadrifasciata TaxID=166423 RepID=A0A0N0BHS4_9HYME|nr:hypothetical protein WN51_11866 [Melipona quadrifasciata]